MANFEKENHMDRRSFIRLSSMGVVLGTASIFSATSAQAAGYGYDYTFSLKGTGGAAWKPESKSGTAMFAFVKPRLASLFPLGGMVNNPTVGKKLQLYVRGTSAKNPVEVVAVGSSSFKLKSLPGHLEGANNYITFSFTGTQMRTYATGPKAVTPPKSWLPYPLWTTFAHSIATKLYVPGVSVPHDVPVSDD